MSIDTKEGAMKLSPTLLERTLDQYEAKAIPDNDPVVPQLTELFGDHTFLLDDGGLSIVEPAEPMQSGAQAGRLVKLADWTADRSGLSPHEPEPTEMVIVLEPH
jgi:hypothetical protein